MTDIEPVRAPDHDRDTADPYLWLEEVQGERALAWVRERNAGSEALLRAEPGFDALRERLREVLDAREQIPYVVRRGPWLYNLWQDADNPRGLWRRTTLDEYRRAAVSTAVSTAGSTAGSTATAWETVLDIDALGRTEGRSWVWGGAAALGPEYRRCLVSLSIGGADAKVLREFDLVDKRFVAAAEGGFTLPEAKTRVEWIDADLIYVGTDFGPGSLTDSGYPRQVKRWRRGQPLAEATLVFEAEAGDISAWASVDKTPGHERTVFGRHLDFYRSQMWLAGAEQSAGGPPTRTLIDKPEDASLSFWRERVLIDLRSDWTISSTGAPRITYRAGSLLVADAAAYLAGERRFEVLFAPTPTRSLASWTTTRRKVLLTVLDNVVHRLEEASPPVAAGVAWARREVKAPSPGTLSVSALHDPLLATDPLEEHLLMNAADFLRPDALLLARTGTDERELLKARPAYFDAAGMRVEQLYAHSRDGTRVPYFVVWPQGARADGDNPALLYGYGGFEVSKLPGYSGTLGRAWCARGGVYVLANIRGGGEFGPAWHQAALRENKQRSYDDFIAVAEDLVARRITRPARLGMQGGSNGGLLVAAVMMQRPELFGAVVCQVPLIDMKRYHRLLAGASWMAEYGDPDKPADWAFMRRTSPYHNVPRAGRGAEKDTGKGPDAAQLPALLVTTSTRDDRVHPGHARKLVARLVEFGHAPLYWENLEGGHGGAADNAQRSLMMALEYSFLWRALKPAAAR